MIVIYGCVFCFLLKYFNLFCGCLCLRALFLLPFISRMCFLFFIQVLETSKPKCLSTNLVTGFSFVSVAQSLIIVSDLSLSSLNVCVCTSFVLMYLILAFISSNRLAFMWHIYLVVVLVELIRLVERSFFFIYSFSSFFFSHWNSINQGIICFLGFSFSLCLACTYFENRSKTNWFCFFSLYLLFLVYLLLDHFFCLCSSFACFVLISVWKREHVCVCV